MCSVSASMATMAFNREFERIAEDWFHDNGPYWKSIGVDVDVDLTIYKRYNAYQKITVCRNRWIIDHEIPIFTQDREYIERLI